MKAIDFLKQHRVYEDETIYNSVGEIVGTVSQLMEEYATLRQPPVVGRSEQLVCPICSSDNIDAEFNHYNFCRDCNHDWEK
jgi:hypothetical protein